MKKKLLFILTFICVGVAWAQVSCPTLNGPFDSDIDVPVDATITWNDVGAPGYRISIGTTMGGNDIINEQPVGNATSFTPPLGLPENSPIYVRLTIFFFNTPDPDIICDVGSFQTVDVTTPPACTTINSPVNGATDINVSSNIVWDYTPTAEGYRLTLGTTLGGSELLNNVDLGNVLSYNPTADLPFNTPVFVRITPYNTNGSAPGVCPQFSFTTGTMATLPGCAQLINPSNGSINVPLTPRLEWTNVPDADGYRVTIGLSPTTGEVVDNLVFTTNSTLVVEFDPNRTFFITIIDRNRC